MRLILAMLATVDMDVFWVLGGQIRVLPHHLAGHLFPLRVHLPEDLHGQGPVEPRQALDGA